MKNVQIIDVGANCTFPVFQFTEVQFALIFGGSAQDIAFAEDVEVGLSEADLALAFDGVWERPVPKAEISGLHGTLFYGFVDRKQYFPVSRRECDWDDHAINAAQRDMNARLRQK